MSTLSHQSDICERQILWHVSHSYTSYEPPLCTEPYSGSFSISVPLQLSLWQGLLAISFHFRLEQLFDFKDFQSHNSAVDTTRGSKCMRMPFDLCRRSNCLASLEIVHYSLENMI